MYFNNIYPSLMKSTNGVTPDIEREKERETAVSFGRTRGGRNTYNPGETKEKQEHLTQKNELISCARVKNWTYQPHKTFTISIGPTSSRKRGENVEAGKARSRTMQEGTER
jgi:hypothetical protein